MVLSTTTTVSQPTSIDRFLQNIDNNASSFKEDICLTKSSIEKIRTFETIADKFKNNKQKVKIQSEMNNSIYLQSRISKEQKIIHIDSDSLNYINQLNKILLKLS